MANPAKLARAQHSYNLLIGLSMTIEERAALLDEVLHRAGLTPLGAAGLEAVSKGPVGNLSETGLTDEALQRLADALSTVDLTTLISEFLAAMTGMPTGAPGPMPKTEPETEAEPEVEPEVEPETDWAWDVVVSLFDPTDRRHHLTLLRSGGSVRSEPAEEEEGFGPLADRLAQTLPEADPVLLEQASHTFHTPACPDEPALLAALLEGTDLEQVYLVHLRHALPNPCRHRRHFQLAEPGENNRWQGRTQALTTELSYRPAGLSLHGARARAESSWGSPARLQYRGSDVHFRPPLLSPGATSTLPLSCDWQLRAGWSIHCAALKADGPQVTITTSAALSGEAILDGSGHLQEHLAGSIGLAAGVRDGAGGQVSTGEAPLPVPDWHPAADVGFGALGVASEHGEYDLTRSGVLLLDATRSTPGIKPRVARQATLSGSTTLTGAALTGATIIDATTLLSDALNDAQSIGSMCAQARAETTLRITFSGGTRSLTLHLTDPDAAAGETTLLAEGLTRTDAAAPAGVVEVDRAARYRLDWRTTTTTLTTHWTDALDAISGDWLGGGESLRDPVEGYNSAEVAWVAGGYRLSAAAAEE
ncbi:MAG: hypothetical protein P8R54_07470 [Myxococcota bacterium]|nr:hypothetical protein [Myxococcota bacterium]